MKKYFEKLNYYLIYSCYLMSQVMYLGMIGILWLSIFYLTQYSYEISIGEGYNFANFFTVFESLLIDYVFNNIIFWTALGLRFISFGFGVYIDYLDEENANQEYMALVKK